MIIPSLKITLKNPASPKLGHSAQPIIIGAFAFLVGPNKKGRLEALESPSFVSAGALSLHGLAHQPMCHGGP